MAKQDIDVGSAPDAGDGEILFDAFNKCINNFEDAYRDAMALAIASDVVTPAGTFRMAVAADSLEAVLVLGTVAGYTHHMLVADDATVPLANDANWLQEEVVRYKTLPDSNLHYYYLWLKNLTVVSQVAPVDDHSDGATVPGFILQATVTDTAPSAITDLVVSRTVGSETTSLDVSFSAATAGSSPIDHYELINPESGGIYDADISPGTTAIGGLPSDTQFPMQIRVIDESGLSNVSNVEIIRTAITAAGIIGIKSVTVRADDAGGYEETENAGTIDLTVALERVNGSAGVVSALIRQVDKTALDTVNYIKTVENGTANKVEWADQDVDYKYVDITLKDVNSLTNLCFQFEIIKGSETGGCTVDVDAYDWGRGDSVLCYINGSASPEQGYIQETTGDHILCIPVEDNVNGVYTPDTAREEDYFTIFDNASPPNGVTESGKMVQPESWITNVSTPTTVASTAARIVIPAVFTQTGDHYCWARVYHSSDGASDQFHAAVGVADDATNNELYNIWADNTANNGVNPRWKWVNVAGGNETLIKNISAAGATTVEIYRFEGRGRWDKILFTTNPDYDPTGIGAVAWRDDPDTPSIDDNLGPTWSAWSDGGTVTDDLGNPIYPTVPDITALPPSILIPIDGTSNVDLQRTEFRAIFTGASNIIGAFVLIQNNATKATIAGATTVEGDSFNEILFTASQNFDSDATYDIFTYATSITNSLGVEQYVAFDSIGDWQFSTVNLGTDFIFRETFDLFAAPHLITGVDNYNTELHDMWNIKTWSPPWGDDYSVQGVFQGYLTIVDDPGGSVSRGNCLRVKLPGDKQSQYPSLTAMARFDYDCTNIPTPSVNSSGDTTDIYPNSTDPKWDLTGGPPDLAAFAAREVRRGNGTEEAYDELYFAYDLRLDPNWYFNFAQKLTGITTATMLQQSHPAGSASADGMYGAGGFKMQIYDSIAWGNPSGALTYYLYDAHRVQQTLFLYRDGILPGGNRSDYYSSTINEDWDRAYVMPRDTWVTIELRHKMNSAPAVLDSGFFNDSRLESQYHNTDAVGDGCLENGEIECWITDPRPVSLDPYLGGTGGVPVKMMSVNTVMMRFHQAFKWDKVYMNTATNAPRLPERPNNMEDQYLYIDNVRVSLNPISH